MRKGIHLQICVMLLWICTTLLQKEIDGSSLYRFLFFFTLSVLNTSLCNIFSSNHLIKQKGELLEFSVFPLAEPKSCTGGREEEKKKKKDVTILQKKSIYFFFKLPVYCYSILVIDNRAKIIVSGEINTRSLRSFKF